MKHDVFISYSRKDSPIARLVYETLMENNVSCFMDTEDISGGQEFSDRLAEEIENSSIFLFLGSANSYTAKWTVKELYFANDLKDKIIIPYCIDNAPVPRDIKIVISNLNIRNIQEHPIETVLLKDVRSALEKLAPKAGKEDLPMVRNLIADITTSSQHTKQYSIDLLTQLGDFNWKIRHSGSRDPRRPKEAKEYYRSAVQLCREHYGQKRFGEDRQVADLFAVIADIEKESNHPDDAEKNYNEAIQRYRINGTRSSLRKDPLIDCLLSLVEIRIEKKEYSLAEEHCLEIKDLLSGSRPLSLYSISPKALKLCELWGDLLRQQGKGIEAVNLYDEVLSLFRNNEKGDRGFGKMLYEFAKSSIKNGDLANAERYLKEAISLDNEYLEALMELARLYKRMDLQAKAISTYNQCFELVMKNSFLDYTFSLRTENVVNEVASYLDSIKRDDEVDNCYLLAIAKFKVDLFTAKTSSARIGNLYESYADWLFDHKRYSEALSFFKECEQLLQLPNSVPRPTETRFWLAAKKTRCLYLIGMEKEALSCLNTALENRRDDLGISNTMNMFYKVAKMLQSSHLDSAVNILKQFIIDNCLSIEVKNRDDLLMYYTELGWFLMYFEEYKYARKPLEKALELSGKEDRPNALNNLGRLYASIGLYDEAEKLLREVVTYYEGAPKKNLPALGEIAESQSYMGLLYLNQGNPAAATVYLEQALNNYKDYSRFSDSRKEDVEQTEQWLEKAKASL